MSNSTSNVDQLSTAQSSLPLRINELFDACSQAMLFGRRASTTSGLSWGFFGGAINNNGTIAQVADGVATLTNTATNYVEATTAGVVSVNTTAFTAGRIPLYTVVVAGGVVTSYTDNRVCFLPATGVPTISSGFGTTPAITANNTSAFKIVIGTGGTASSGVITLPAATNGWIADANDVTNNALFVTSQSAETTTSVTLTNYSRTTGAVTPWTAGDEIHVRCAPY